MKISVLLFVVLFVSQACARRKRPKACRTCPVGWTFWGNACYRIFNNPISTWDHAEASCNGYSLKQKKRRLTGHLAAITSSEENTFVLDLWRSIRGDTGLWLGYNDKKVEGTFVDGEGVAPKFTFWDSDEPNDREGEDCVGMWNTDANQDNGSWNDFPCENQYAFVCKISR
ncbi:alpha-N-acetylgalactosamine-specific lectin-like [Apostichopus japonicus]|uniref:alpha-N-acetylgalactosamine-specific lectin-like n=1 Tax=Stichopus japonicus TaxID=307972 RepID=UPI003AB81876